MAVTMADISKLRTMTGAGMMDCKNALTEAENDFEKAIEIIRKKGKAIAAKRSDREASEGCVLATDKGGFAAIVALQCETDFVAKNADFIALTQSILDAAMANCPASLDELKAIKIDGRSIEDLVIDRSGITGEKMELGSYEFVKGNTTISYIHPGNKLATIVSFNENIDHQISREVAMQVAAMSPVALNREQVPAHIVETELEIGRDKARQEGKPEAMLDKIAEGRLNKFYKESTLLEQEFIKDAKISVQQYLKQQSATLTATGFKRVTLNQE
ncbi:MAG: elongation factor Ts [Paludibacteraceae bacterium]|jgi:elongation factor Ts|nr:elongation factor Ts [Paludibacteraceae bacterium]HPG55140.1 translation elongation factor Ts [Candidatus Enterocola sp.]